MPKSTTKATGKATKPITDFFTRRPRTISHDSCPQPSQSPKRALNPSNTKKNSKDRIRDQDTNAMPALKVDVPTRPVASLPTPLPDSEPGHRSTRNATKSKALHSHNESALGLGLPVTSSQSTINDKTTSRTAVKPSGKRKKNIEDDSDNEHRLDSMITVMKRSTNKAKAHTFILTPSPTAKVNVAPALATPPISHKRPRLLSPEPSSIVPSSQSDEMEVDVSRLSIREADVVKDSVHKWRQDPQLVSIKALQSREASVPATLLASEDDHHSVVSGSSATSLPRSSPGEISARTSNTSVIDDDCIPDVYAGSLTPPPSSPRAAHSMKAPVALSGEAKAAQIIADIKARCEASRESSEERVLRDFKDNLDSDSDLEELLINPINMRKSTRASKQEPSANASSSGSKRYDLRAKRSSLDGPAARPPPAKYPKTITDVKGKGKATGRPSAGSRRVENPLDALLKEKKNAEKKGKGADALRAAETAVAGKQGLLAEMDEEDPAWQDEGAAFSALKYRDRLEKDLSSDGAHDDHEMGEEDQQRLFGRKCSKSIKVILDKDKGKAVDTESESKPFGIPLWLDATDQMEVEPEVPQFTPPDDNPVWGSLAAALTRQDVPLSSLLLETLPTSLLSSIVPYACQLALSDDHPRLGLSAYLALNRLWSGPLHSAAVLPVSVLYSALHHLGADPAILLKAGWALVDPRRRPTSDSTTREKMLYRLVYLTTSAARFGSLVPQEIPDVLLLLSHVALDPSCSQDITRDLIMAVHDISSSIGPCDDVIPDIESAVCNKLLGFLVDVEPINKDYVVGLLASGSGRTMRIARVIARSIILDKRTVTSTGYSNLPPLFPLVKALLDDASGRDIFQINSQTDYVDLGYYVHILAVALSAIDLYTENEKAQKPEPFSPSMLGLGRRPEKPDTPLQLIKLALDSLHSRIADTRAAHLDRSRTKAAIKQLSMRIHYQRRAAVSSYVNRKQSIQSYFAPASR
ncbi:hypothetical protein CCMSSC00406_0005505 [Pleurotus cornucopiae]|uniref:Uncharacterized protein n=1 Tax=Pleurotus cornucopiae TaxID=5321 RepID=A0ACB7ITW2_PLECO|nr:hypothetical protein CCMSSC00406_0005505 [Pleurotus cornucopiae]